MKHILIFSLAYYPNQIGGAESSIKDITDRIDQNDIEFHMVTLRYNSELKKTEKVGNVLVHRIGITRKNPSFQDLGKMPLDLNKPLFQFLAAGKACKLHRQYKYDAIWAMMAHPTGVPAVIFKLTHPKVKYFLTLQEGDPIDYIEKTMRPLWPLFTRAFTKADKVQVISTFLANWAKKRGVPDDKIELIYDGANPRDLNEVISEQEINDLKKSLNKKPGEIYLVNTARLVHQKANDDVIRALKLLPDNIKFLLVGDGQDEQMLKALTKELSLENRVIFTGRVDRSEVTKYRKVGDIFVCPSRSEGLGHALLSAMASYLPVIATQEGGLAEFIFDAQKNPDKETTAWAVDKDSPEQIANAVKDILANPDNTKKITTTARRMVETKYNWDMIAKDMMNKIFN
jgi:glycosyltransferase involved in cell wall biosynthesis